MATAEIGGQKGILVAHLITFADWQIKCASLGLAAGWSESVWESYVKPDAVGFPSGFVLNVSLTEPWQLVSPSLQLKVTLDLEKDLDYRRREARGGDPLLKAIGKASKRVLDCTFGFGRDSVFLAQKGIQVLAYERNLFLFLLMKEALSRTKSAWAKNIELVFGDFTQALRVKETEFDAVYFDPLFEPDKKKSKSRKEMEMLREVLNYDLDYQSSFETLMHDCPKRLIVKRADKASSLRLKEKILEQEKLRKCLRSVYGKTVRFDIY